MRDQIQNWCSAVLVEYLPEPHGSLLVGILLGLQESLPEPFYEALIATGTVHIVAASGFNVTIIAKVLIDWLQILLPRRLAISLSWLGIWGFVWLSGASAAVIRAGVMATIAYTALYFGRKYTATWALLLTILIVLLVQPRLVENIGFWLSATATAGVLWLTGDSLVGVSGFEKALVKFGYQIPTIKTNVSGGQIVNQVMKVLVIDFQTTVAAQVATLPILYVIFGQVSLVSPLINVLILWLIPLIMFLGVLKLFLGGALGLINRILGLIVMIPLEMMVRLVNWGGEIDWWLMTIGEQHWSRSILSPLSLILGYYLILFVILLLIRRKLSGQKKEIQTKN